MIQNTQRLIYLGSPLFFFPSFPLPFLSHVHSLPEQPGVRHPRLWAMRSRQEGPLGWDMVSGCTNVLEVRLGHIQFPVPMSSPGGPPLWWLWLFKKRESWWGKSQRMRWSSVQDVFELNDFQIYNPPRTY